MKVAGRRVIALLGALLGQGACEAGPTAPHLEAVLPARGLPGSVVELVGERLAGTVRAVSFSAVPAPVISWEERRLRARVPEGPRGLVLVVASVDGRASNGVSYLIEGSISDGGSPESSLAPAPSRD